MRIGFFCALAGVLVSAAGCTTGDGGDGAGGSGGTGTGGNVSTLETVDAGDCAPSGTLTSLDYEVIYSSASGGATDWISDVVDFSACMPVCGDVYNAVITDQEHYQPFQDHGLPAVDFTTSVVMISAGRDPSNGGVPVAFQGPKISSVDGTPHFEIGYRFTGTHTDAGCIYYDFVEWSLVAVKIAIPAATPTFCTHVTTGC